MNALLRKLTGGDRRSIGRVREVVDAVLANPRLFAAVFDGMTDPDPLIRMRCADAVEKVTVHRPASLRPHTKRVLRLAGTADQQEVRWHLAQLLSRVELTPPQRRRAVRILYGYLSDRSRIVQVCAMQTLAEIAQADAAVRGPIIRRLERLTRTGSPAVRSRGRKLLARLGASM